MPCTEGGTPVTIERLFGLVKHGTTQSAISAVPLASTSPHPRHVAARDRLVEIVGFAAIDAHDDRRLGAAGSCVR